MGIRAMIARCVARAEVLPLIATEAAAEIQADLRLASTTRAGNVPLYGGPLRGNVDGTVPTTATASGATITIRAVDWVLRKAREKGQPAEWIGTVQRVALRRLRAIR
jgi:hypothetical protein